MPHDFSNASSQTNSEYNPSNNEEADSSSSPNNSLLNSPLVQEKDTESINYLESINIGYINDGVTTNSNSNVDFQLDQTSPIPDFDPIVNKKNEFRRSVATEATESDLHSCLSSRDSMDSLARGATGLSKRKENTHKSSVIPSSSILGALLGGKSLGYFDPNHPLRLFLARFFHQPLTKIFINLLIVLNWFMLVLQHWKPNQRTNKFGEMKSDYGILVIQILYIFELIGKVIIFGFIKNPPPIERITTLQTDYGGQENLLSRNIEGVSSHFIPHLSYLNDPLNKIDFLAICSYWIDLILTLTIPSHQIYIFKMLSTIRPIRLLITIKYVSVIIQSLINSKSVLINILFFLVYFFVIFGLLGMLLFDGKLRGRCVFPDNQTLIYPLKFCAGNFLDKSHSRNKVQYLNSSGALPWSQGYICSFGQICKDIGNPWGGYYGFDNFGTSILLMYQIAATQKWSHLLYMLIEVDSWAVIFFFILSILVLNYWLFTLFVAVITRMFGKTKGDNVRLMALVSRRSAKLEQNVQDSSSWDIKVEAKKEHMDIFHSDLDFTDFWKSVDKLLNQGRHLVYKLKGNEDQFVMNEDEVHLSLDELKKKLKVPEFFRPCIQFVLDTHRRVKHYFVLLRLFHLVPWIGVIKSIGKLLVLTQLVCLILVPPSSMAGFGLIGLYNFLFDVEIGLRIVIKISVLGTGYQIPIDLLDKIDLALAIINTIITLIPPQSNGIFNHSLTIFSLLRFYRLISYLPRVQNLLRIVASRYRGFVDLACFVILSYLVCVPMGMAILGGISPQLSIVEPVDMNFDNFRAALLSLNQIFSGEDWGQLMFRYMESVGSIPMAILISLFIVVWSGFSTFVLLNLFIAITMEGFEIVENQKKSEQVSSYVDKVSKSKMTNCEMDLQSKLRTFLTSQLPNTSRIGSLPNSLSLSVPMEVQQEHFGKSGVAKITSLGEVLNVYGCFSWVKNIFSQGYDFKKIESSVRSPSSIASTIHEMKSSSRMSVTESQSMNKEDSIATYETTKHNSVLAHFDKPEINREILMEYNGLGFPIRTWFIFNFNNRWRRFCCWLMKDDPELQDIDYSFNSQYQTPIWKWTPFTIFNNFIWAINILNVFVATIDTPLFRKTETGVYIFTIQILTIIFTLIFTGEFFIVTTAVGFCFAKNSYLKQFWRRLDFIVLLLMWFDMIVDISGSSNYSRLWSALKSFRTLRLITLSPILKKTIYTLFVSGFRGMIDVVMLLLVFAIPYSIYGYLLFSEMLMRCNANDVEFLEQCQGLFISPLSGILVGRVWSNPLYFNFDTLSSSLVLHLEILSRERWVHVMGIAMDIVGPGIQPKQDASWYTSLYFVSYYAFGSVFVLTMFITVVIENYRRFTGVSYLTADQRRYNDLKKQISSVNPSKHPPSIPDTKYRKLCYKLATQKHGILNNFTTIMLMLIVLFSVMQYQGQNFTYRTILSAFIFVCTLGLTIEIPVVWLGLGQRNFWAKRWNVLYYSVLIITTFMSLLDLALPQNSLAQFLAKIFQTLLLLKFIVKSDRLQQLANILVASSRDLLSFGMVVGTVMLFFSILLIQTFSLTKLGHSGSKYINFRNWVNSFILILKMTTGEDWNEIMHDYTVQSPHCVASKVYLDTDCGNETVAYIIFLTYNIVSMYILMNMLIVLVLENFSFCYDITASFDLLNREEIRRFKGLWKQIDPDMTGKINADKIIQIMKLGDGYLDCKLYPQNLQVHSLLCEYSIFKKTKWTVPARIDVDGKLVKLKLQSTKLKRSGKWILDAIPNEEIIEYMIWVQNKVVKSNWAARLKNGTFSLCRRRFNITYYQFQFLTEDHSKDDGEIGDITYVGNHKDFPLSPISINDCLKLICQVNLIEPENCFLIDELLEYKNWYNRHVFRYQHQLLIGLVRTYLSCKHFKLMLSISNGEMDFSCLNMNSRHASNLRTLDLSRENTSSVGSYMSRQLSNESSVLSKSDHRYRSKQMEHINSSASETKSILSEIADEVEFQNFKLSHWNNVLRSNCDDDDDLSGLMDDDSLFGEDYDIPQDLNQTHSTTKDDSFHDEYSLDDYNGDETGNLDIEVNSTNDINQDLKYSTGIDDAELRLTNEPELPQSDNEPDHSTIPDIIITEVKPINGHVEAQSDEVKYEDEAMFMDEDEPNSSARNNAKNDDIAYESDED